MANVGLLLAPPRLKLQGSTGDTSAYISRTLSWPREGGYKFIDTDKTKKSYRTLPISPMLMDKLRDHHKTQMIYKKYMAEQSKWEDHNLIFSSDTGSRCKK
jgi:hypothetical protein